MIKQYLLTIFCLFISFTIFSQSPEAIKYQGVVRDAAGVLVEEQAVSFQFKIHDGSSTGPIVYTETHTINTNKYGVVSLEIGNGSTSDAFSSIPWGTGDKFLEILIDLSGGSSYTAMGAFQLVSVPYALYANETGSVSDNAISSSKIQPNAVTLDKIDNSGATSGDVLIFDGSSLSWGAAATSSGDITSVTAGNGLTGGAVSGDAELNIGAGTGIVVAADDISLNESHTDALYVNEGQNNAISSAMIQNGAVSTEKIGTTGATTGEVLIFDGTSLDWGTVATSSGDITSVTAGDGLTGGAVSGDAALNIGAGTGITVAADEISLNETHTNALYVNEGQNNSVSTAMVQDAAITNVKVSGSGATSGQVLSYNGTNVEWTTPASPSGNTLDQAYDEGGAGAGRVINATNGPVHVTGAGGILSDANIGVGLNNANDDDAISFDYGSSLEQLIWDNSETEFVLTDDLRVIGIIGTSSGSEVYNTLYELGTAAVPVSGEMTSAGDLHIEFDLEVGSDLYVGGRMLGSVPGISQGRVSGNVYITNTSAMADVVTTSISIPAAGYIMIECDGMFVYSGTTSANYIYHQIDETSGGAVDGHYNRIAGANVPPNTSAVYVSATNRRTYYKASAGTYTFRWEAEAFTTSGTKRFWNPTISATYIPRAHGAVTSFVTDSEANNFYNKTTVDTPELEEGHNTTYETGQYYKVDLREGQINQDKKEKTKQEK